MTKVRFSSSLCLQEGEEAFKILNYRVVPAPVKTVYVSCTSTDERTESARPKGTTASNQGF